MGSCCAVPLQKVRICYFLICVYWRLSETQGLSVEEACCISGLVSPAPITARSVQQCPNLVFCCSSNLCGIESKTNSRWKFSTTKAQQTVPCVPLCTAPLLYSSSRPCSDVCRDSDFDNLSLNTSLLLNNQSPNLHIITDVFQGRQKFNQSCKSPLLPGMVRTFRLGESLTRCYRDSSLFGRCGRKGRANKSKSEKKSN